MVRVVKNMIVVEKSLLYSAQIANDRARRFSVIAPWIGRFLGVCVVVIGIAIWSWLSRKG